MLHVELAMRALARGERGRELPAEGGSANRRLAQAFNEMLGALQKREATQTQLNQSYSALIAAEVVAAVAHDVKNPLVGVLGFSQLGQESKTPAEMLEYLGLVEKDALRANALLKDLLERSRPVEPALKAVQLNALVTATLALAPLAQTSVEFLTELDSSLPSVNSSDEVLTQVLLCVLVNAAQAVAQSPVRQVRIATSHGDDGISVRISDSGPGVAPEIEGRLFRPFVSTKPRSQGLGLGLSMSRGLIENLGGTLTVERGPLSGATFVLWLPRRTR